MITYTKKNITIISIIITIMIYSIINLGINYLKKGNEFQTVSTDIESCFTVGVARCATRKDRWDVD